MRGFERSPRVDLRRAATLINADGDPVSVTILDISRDGFRVMTAEPVRVGERVTIVHRKERLSGQIRWALGNEAGGAFLD